MQIEKAKKLGFEFFDRDVLTVAPELVGKVIVSRLGGREVRIRISETESYCGVDDTACHVHRGRTPRTEIFYGESGLIYVYLCYGIHWLMNVITGGEENPQGVLLRAGVDFGGPAKLTKALGVTGEINKQNICRNDKIWIEDDGFKARIRTDKRVGISYAEQKDIDKPWRFILDNQSLFI